MLNQFAKHLPAHTLGGAISMNFLHKATRTLGSALAAIMLTACVATEPPASSSSAASSDTVSSTPSTPSSSSTATSSTAPSSIASSSSAPVVSSSQSSVASSSSAPVSSSSAPVSSSSAATTSSVSAVGDFSGTPDLENGKTQYESATLKCSQCHGVDGSANGFDAIDGNNLSAARRTFEVLAPYLHTDMPTILAQPETCKDSCARDIAAYILNGFKTDTAPTGDHTVVEEKDRTERVTKGKNFFQRADLTCAPACHTTEKFFQCEHCDSWENLRDYISAEMPKFTENNGQVTLQPSACTSEDGCADRITDYIWNEINGWALTTVNGEASGIKTVTENRTGQDTLRLKTYDMLSADFDRIFGGVPSVLAGSRPAFKPEPAYWHTEGETGAVALNVIVNAAIQSCDGESLPALNEAALRTSCADWAQRMWLRDATEAELQSCIDVALIDTSDLSDAKTRASYACVSMMTSLPALTF